MNHACRYAIVRFMPYPETSEFANVGIVLMCPTAKFFGFKMLGRSVRRITDFFNELDTAVFKNARQLFEKDLNRIQLMVEHAFAGFGLKSNTMAYVDGIFNELLRPKEAIMYLAEPRAVLTSSDPALKLNELFEYYVARSFAAKLPYERLIEKKIQNILSSVELTGKFQKMEIGDDQYHTKFPFVYVDQNKNPLRAIKALNLAHDDAVKLFDHGWDWVGKVKMLRKANILPEHVLFATERPNDAFGHRALAYAEVKQELERYDVQVVSTENEDKIIEFASA